MFLWQPLGFGNVFHYPSLTPVTPIGIKLVPTERHIVEYHQQLFLAIVFANGVTWEQVEQGYWEWDGNVKLTIEQLEFYTRNNWVRSPK